MEGFETIGDTFDAYSQGYGPSDKTYGPMAGPSGGRALTSHSTANVLSTRVGLAEGSGISITFKGRVTALTTNASAAIDISYIKGKWIHYRDANSYYMGDILSNMNSFASNANVSSWSLVEDSNRDQIVAMRPTDTLVHVRNTTGRTISDIPTSNDYTLPNVGALAARPYLLRSLVTEYGDIFFSGNNIIHRKSGTDVNDKFEVLPTPTTLYAGVVETTDSIVAVGRRGISVAKKSDTQTWTNDHMDDLLLVPGASSNRWVDVAASADGTSILAVNYQGEPWLSLDSGQTWNKPYTDHIGGNGKKVFVSDDGNILLVVESTAAAAALTGMRISKDGGLTWETKGFHAATAIRAVTMSSSGIIGWSMSGGPYSMYLSYDYGDTHTIVPTTFTSRIESIYIENDQFLAVGIYGSTNTCQISRDGGNTWQHNSVTWPSSGNVIKSIIRTKNYLIFQSGSTNYVIKYDLNTQTFDSTLSSLMASSNGMELTGSAQEDHVSLYYSGYKYRVHMDIPALYTTQYLAKSIPQSVYKAYTTSNYTFLATQNGIVREVSQGKFDSDIVSCCSDGQTIMVGGTNGEIYVSHDNGTTFSKRQLVPIANIANPIEYDSVYVAHKNGIWLAFCRTHGLIYRSTDTINFWTQSIQVGTYDTQVDICNWPVLGVVHDKFIIDVGDAALRRAYSDDGIYWSYLDSISTPNNVRSITVTLSPKTNVGSDNVGFGRPTYVDEINWYSSNLGGAALKCQLNEWYTYGIDLYVNDRGSLTGDLYVDQEKVGFNDDISLSSFLPYADGTIAGVHVSREDTVFYYGSEGIIIRRADEKEFKYLHKGNFQYFDTGNELTYIVSGVDVNRPIIQVTNDAGLTWTTLPFHNNSGPVRISTDGLVIAALDVTTATLYVSVDGGLTFTSTEFTGTTVGLCMSADGSQIYLKEGLYVVKSTDFGISWTTISASTTTADAGIACSDDGLVLITRYGAYNVVLISTDGGVTWSQFASTVAGSRDGLYSPVVTYDGKYAFFSTPHATYKVIMIDTNAAILQDVGIAGPTAITLEASTARSFGITKDFKSYTVFRSQAYTQNINLVDNTATNEFLGQANFITTPFYFIWNPRAISSIDDVVVSNYISPNFGMVGECNIRRMEFDTDVQSQWSRFPTESESNVVSGATTPRSKSNDYSVEAVNKGDVDIYGTSSGLLNNEVGTVPIAVQLSTSVKRTIPNDASIQLGLRLNSSVEMSKVEHIVKPIIDYTQVNHIVQKNVDTGESWKYDDLRDVEIIIKNV